MGATEIFRVEMGAFLLGLVLLLGGRMASGKISLRGLFRSGESVPVSPERVLLFVAMVLVSCVFVVRMVAERGAEVPDLGVGWLLLFGTSCVVYVGVTAFRTFRGKNS